MWRRGLMVTVVAVLGAAGVVVPAWSQLGKWVDPQGRIYYGDSPPAQTLVKEKSVSRGAVSLADGAHFQSAPTRWNGRAGTGGGAVVERSVQTSAPAKASSGGYWRCE
jgi:hypothetical protein